MSDNSLKLENLLSKKLPNEYREFINSKGFLSKNGIEIYGYSPELDISKIPCVIGATILYKKLYPLKENELVIAFDDLNNNPILLNIDNGHIYEIKEFNSRKLINNNFKEFYSEIIKNN